MAFFLTALHDLTVHNKISCRAIYLYAAILWTLVKNFQLAVYVPVGIVVIELFKYIWDQGHLNLMHFVWKLSLVTRFHLF